MTPLDASVYSSTAASCVNGTAGGFPCKNIDLLAVISLSDMNIPTSNSDIWGWYDEVNRREYVIACGYDRTVYVDVTDPSDFVVVASMPSSTGRGSTWCSAKTYKNFNLIVRDFNTGHGVQSFDLSRLESLRDRAIETGRIQTVDEDFLYGDLSSVHNMVIDTAIGMGYAVGSTTCAGGLHQLDLSRLPIITYAGCFSRDGYTHDSQCVVYSGPDQRYLGREICFNYNEDSLTITDNTDPANVTQISRTEYIGSQYTHQGWLTMDGEYMLMNDELDEGCQVNPNFHGICGANGPVNQTSHNGKSATLIWNMKDLRNPFMIGMYVSTETAIDHDEYIYPQHPNIVYQSNYCAGIRVLNVENVAQGLLTEVGFFDLEPECSTVAWRGTWANYLLPSGNLIASNIYKGVFVLRVDDSILE